MPPRYSYWTILAGGLPTSFRAADREDLLPTLRRLLARHPDAEMKWFQRGKLWESPEAARADFEKARAPRGREWRPGGEHRDPREPFKARKRERNQARRQQRFVQKHGRPDEQKIEGRDPQDARSHPQRRSITDRPKSRRNEPRHTPRGGRRR
jgi:hypothetical protein